MVEWNIVTSVYIVWCHTVENDFFNFRTKSTLWRSCYYQCTIIRYLNQCWRQDQIFHLPASLFSQLYQPIPARHCQRISQADAAKGFHLATAKEGGFKYTFTVKLMIRSECHEAQEFLSKNWIPISGPGPRGRERAFLPGRALPLCSWARQQRMAQGDLRGGNVQLYILTLKACTFNSFTFIAMFAALSYVDCRACCGRNWSRGKWTPTACGRV